MKKYDDIFLELVDDFSKHSSVEAILLCGSRVGDTFDEDSDYDLYIYTTEDLPLDFRENIANKYFSHVELNNSISKKEDQGIFKKINVQIDIIYREIKQIEKMLEDITIRHHALTGYTTCYWENLVKSNILYDKNGELSNLKKKFDVDYPKELRKNIIAKNFPFLNKIAPVYASEIKKALKRNDLIRVNKKINEFFESYFDIIFALNMKLHTGEKNLLKITTERLKHLPRNMESDIRELFEGLYNEDFDTVDKLNEIIHSLRELLKEMNLI
ncbi:MULTISPECIES: DUF4037 domain-containing protein [Psychrilyobacter]|uniref:DUF4037 domain-containing protein n=1 Tax=Psychrilyobacter piezotolerans TaxID=2293438 RepID=A0ABX9KD61_9FUSO|nr:MULTISPECIES: DUF4037 domain-containing protein [Psychrilyobacter]MCS5423060.1 DUF4037 domain-containing protein [Psychrilyobacter sp. S5]NDI79270.1 DUF4037 domain-containing protein [Psychrilyobacter piezotolerans]RDE58799.1 DUF4037 domain-containing protein [Psychrilyobacter sp. S5]REI39282.1 DUF4037 domain-containing protein [Psychrilyobacter piezotolerans]